LCCLGKRLGFSPFTAKAVESDDYFLILAIAKEAYHPLQVTLVLFIGFNVPILHIWEPLLADKGNLTLLVDYVPSDCENQCGVVWSTVGFYFLSKKSTSLAQRRIIDRFVSEQALLEPEYGGNAHENHACSQLEPEGVVYGASKIRARFDFLPKTSNCC